MSRPLVLSNKNVRSSNSLWLIVTLIFTVSACGTSSTTSEPAIEQTTQSLVPTTIASGQAAGITPSGSGAYITLADFQASQESYSESKVVLFFTATWCSTCKKARSNLESDLSAIPSDLTIVLVDFDSETDLKRQYGITVQHTFVQIDTDGSELAKWSGSLTAQEIVENTI